MPGMSDARIVVLTTVSSTNDEMRRLAERGAKDGTVVIAGEQTAGRGRRGSRWHSAPGLGLYLSALFRPGGRSEQLTRWTLAASVAAVEACREAGASEVCIDWPNDLTWRGKKLAGILTQRETPKNTRPRHSRGDDEYSVLDAMVDDISRGINVVGGQLWHTKSKGCQ